MVAMSARTGSNGMADETHGGALTKSDDVRASSGRPDITSPTLETRGRLAVVASRSDESVPFSHLHARHGNEAGCSTA